MEKAHTDINWQNEPSEATALNDVNLNKMDQSIDVIDNRVIVLDNQRQTDEYNISQLQDTASTQGTAISNLQSSVVSQGSAITALQNGKVDKVVGKGLSTNDFSNTLKTKLSGIATNAKNVLLTSYVSNGTKVAKIITQDQNLSTRTLEIYNGIEVDSALSSSSENPVQNKVVKTALDGKVDKEAGKGLFNLSDMQFNNDTMNGEVIAHIIMHSQNPDPLEPDMEFDIFNGMVAITNAEIDALE